MVVQRPVELDHLFGNGCVKIPNQTLEETNAKVRLEKIKRVT